MGNAVRVCGLVVALAAVILAGRAWSESKPALRPKVRIGILNVNRVLRGYEKVKAFGEKMNEAAKPYQKMDRETQEEADALAKEWKGQDTTAGRKEQIEKRLNELARAAEENKNEAQQRVRKLQQEQQEELFADVEVATARYAKENDLDLVLRYNDPPKKDEWTAQSITRKAQAEGLMPLYSAPGLDISKEVLDALNKEYKRKKAG